MLVVVATELLVLLFHIPYVPGSNHSPETGHPCYRFSWFSLVHPAECRDIQCRIKGRASQSAAMRPDV